MDTSKKYIEICEKAEEIQKQWKPQIGDCFYWRSELCDEILDLEYFKDENGILTDYVQDGLDDKIWLPKQDQLQEMLNLTTYKLISNFSNLIDIAIRMNKKKITLGELINQYSMEQLWLAYVMDEKFGKVWDGKEWIKKNDTADE